MIHSYLFSLFVYLHIHTKTLVFCWLWGILPSACLSAMSLILSWLPSGCMQSLPFQLLPPLLWGFPLSLAIQDESSSHPSLGLSAPAQRPWSCCSRRDLRLIRQLCSGCRWVITWNLTLARNQHLKLKVYLIFMSFEKLFMPLKPTGIYASHRWNFLDTLQFSVQCLHTLPSSIRTAVGVTPGIQFLSLALCRGNVHTKGPCHGWGLLFEPD